MHSLKRQMKAVVGLSMLLSASCSTLVLCDPGSYSRGVEQCPTDRYALKLTLAADRTDLRAPSDLPVLIQASATDIVHDFEVRQIKSVQLDIDGAAVTDIRHTFDEATQHVIVNRSPEQLKLGALRVTVALPVLPAVQTDGLHRVFRAPRLVATGDEVTGTMTSSNRSGTVTGRAAVQVASPVGAPGQLLALEEVMVGGQPFRWLDLYDQGSGTTLVHANNAQWQLTQNYLQQGPLAQERLIQGAVVIYDYDAVTKRVDLALQPLQGSALSGLSKVEPRLPADATALAGCSEEPVVLLANPSAVSAYLTDPSGGAQPLVQIGAFTTQGPAVIAARDTQGAVPTQRSVDYFAVVWEAGGKGTLLKLARTASRPTGIEVGPDVSSVGEPGVIAAALADLDSDGLQDLVLAAADGTLKWSPQHSDTSFAAATPLGVVVPKAVSISIGDVNQDGLPDVAVATTDKRLLIFRNQP